MTSILREDQYFDTETDFCVVTGAAAMNQLEQLLLRNRISYFIKVQERSIFQKIFGRRSREEVFVVRINNRDVAAAAELAAEVPNVRIIGKVPEQDWSPKEKLRRLREEGRQREEDYIDDEE